MEETCGSLNLMMKMEDARGRSLQFGWRLLGRVEFRPRGRLMMMA